MKKMFFAVATALFAASAVSAQETIIEMNQLPANAQSFISTYYAGDEASLVTLDKEGLKKDYKVVFESGAKVEFDKKGEWKDVEAKKGGEVPAALVPATISKYIKGKFPKNKVVGIDKDKKIIDIELNNDVDLKFNKKGGLVEFDS